MTARSKEAVEPSKLPQIIRVDARLQLADPVPAFGKRQTLITLQMIFEPVLVELFLIEESEFGRQATQSPDQAELCGDNVDNEPKPRFTGEFEPVLGLSLHLAQRIAACEKIRVQVVAAISRKGEITGSICGIEGATHQASAGLDVPCPRHDEISEGHVGTGLVAMQTALLHQIVAKSAKLEFGLVVAKVRPKNHAEPNISKARSVAVAMFEAEIDHPANHQ
jgi:hypothetical protein